MIVTSSRKPLFLSLGHSFEIFSCEGLIHSLDALYPAEITQKTKNMIFLSSFHGDFRPEAIKRRRKRMDLFRKLHKEESECQY